MDLSRGRIRLLSHNGSLRARTESGFSELMVLFSVLESLGSLYVDSCSLFGLKLIFRDDGGSLNEE